jgi:hypothetical protein
MITQLDERHIGLVRFEGNIWYAVRPMEPEDEAGLLLNPIPFNCADRRVMHNDKEMAAELVLGELSEATKIRFQMSEERFDQINREITKHLQAVRDFTQGCIMAQQAGFGVG